MKTTVTLSEPYLFTCNAGLVQLSVPFYDDGNLEGCFFVGPFYMGASRHNMTRHLLGKFTGSYIETDFSYRRRRLLNLNNYVLKAYYAGRMLYFSILPHLFQGGLI